MWTIMILIYSSCLSIKFCFDSSILPLLPKNHLWFYNMFVALLFSWNKEPMLYSGKAPSLQEECHASAWPQLTTDLPLSSVSWIGPGDNAVGCFFKKMLSVYLLARKKKKKKVMHSYCIRGRIGDIFLTRKFKWNCGGLLHELPP